MTDMKNEAPLLSVRELRVSFPTRHGTVFAVNGISYDVHRGEVMGIIGESGSGKSVEAYSVMRLLKAPGRIDGGSIRFEDTDLLSLTKRELEDFRGTGISMVFQDPLTCLDPVYTIGRQLTETLHTHKTVTRREASERSVEMLRRVGIHNAERVMRQYPFELSGGMRQRVMIAMALLCEPKLLIADEPTTALDVTIQEQILRLLRGLRESSGMAMVFITHNFGVVADICDSVSVMYGGYIVEQGPVDDVFYRPAHPYTRALLSAIPRIDAEKYSRLIPIEGVPIDPLAPPPGCPFAPRCPCSTGACDSGFPKKTMLTPRHSACCALLDRASAAAEDKNG